MKIIKRRLVVVFSIVSVVAVAASAQNNRSAVSVSGNDLNPCTPASPCRSFGAAIAVTAPGGEIVALTSAGYGPFTVPMSVTISGAPGVHAAITATTGTAITVYAGPTDRVILRNLVLIGGGADYGILHGVGGELDVIHCLIRAFAQDGIAVGSDGAERLLVDDTSVLDNSVDGIGLTGDMTGVNFVDATIKNSMLQGNNVGINAIWQTKVVVTNCTITGNTTIGVKVTSAAGSGLLADMVLESCLIAHTATGVQVYALGNNIARVTLSQNVIAFTTVGVSQLGIGARYTFGNNRFTGNGTDTDSSLTPVAFK